MSLEQLFRHYIERSEMGFPDYEKQHCLEPIARYSERYRRLKPALQILEQVHPFFVTPGSVLFVGLRFKDLASQLARLTPVSTVIPGFTDYQASLALGIRPIPFWSRKMELFEAYQDFRSSGSLDERRVNAILGRTEKLLARVKPRGIVLGNDVEFPERLIILAARRLGVPTFVVQHGVYMTDDADARIIGGDFADHVLVWGEFFADLFADATIVPRERIGVLGYPYPAPKPAAARSPHADQTVCILGQDWELYDARLEAPKKRFIENIAAACARAQLKLVYRPHPTEGPGWLSRNLPMVALTPADETLDQAFDRYDAFMSLTSTALIEAGMRGRLAVQIRDSHFVQDDFETIGACYSVANDPDDLARFLQEVVQGERSALAVSPRYIQVLEDPASRLLELVRALPAQRAAEPQVVG